LKIVCLALTLGLVVAGTAADAASIERLRQFVRDTQTARTPFTQVVTDKSGRVVQTVSGQFDLARPGRFRWSVEKPYRQLLVGDGQKVWVFDPDLNQVIVRNMGEALGASPAALLAGKADVETAFAWKDQPVADGLDWLSATPLAKDSTFSEIRLGFDANGLAALELFDAFGQKSVVRFTAFERNPKLTPELFKFTPPKGADVIGP
jgi:outer membrane lipoprotein carrier protein